MADRIAQRLIAAGATPERARAFSQQFAAARPGAKKRELEDAFDAELGAISQAVWPNTFRPPSVDDPEVDNYITGIYGEEELDRLDTRAWQRVAPNTFKLLPTVQSATDAKNLKLDEYIVWSLLRGNRSPGDLTVELTGDTGLERTGQLTPSEIGSLVNRYANEISKVETAQKSARDSFLKNDKYYKAGLPHPKLKYGETTDLAKGIIDFRTHPGVSKALTDPTEKQKFMTQRQARVERASGLAATAGDVLSRRELTGIQAQDPEQLYEQDIFKRFTEKNSSPFFDEVKRRESVKGKTIK